jgi:arylsulfatase A-like enzyme
LGSYGIPNLNTPTLDNLAKKGLLFRNSFATNPGCSSNKATIATGKDPLYFAQIQSPHYLKNMNILKIFNQIT